MYKISQIQNMIYYIYAIIEKPPCNVELCNVYFR